MERIDVHCHAVPPRYREFALKNGHSKPDGMPALPAWDLERHIALMQKLNITKSILSISSPGTHLKPHEDAYAAQVTRETNDELSEICQKHPGYFSFFASLPLPAVDESVQEIDHALDKLDAAGFIILSNFHGIYPGDKALDPVFAKLNERKAVVFIHPTTCNVISPTGQVQAVTPLTQYPRPMMEFLFDETRAVVNLLVSGTVAKFPNIQFIMSHGGCTMPPLVDRVGGFGGLIGGDDGSAQEFIRLLRTRFFFDLAGFPIPNQIHGLLRLLGNDGDRRIVYGTDHCFTPEVAVLKLAKQLDEGCREIFSEEQQRNAYSENAKRLLKGI